ncbi:ABC transporter ATP-binding protein [Rathayibacter soli]|uniref:ABC transporter ATP-binding protein n=1 Tax=Rathayibacter soli TaxID=3144168 RepID=UPI0027E54E31|nr:ABC transporter ATP-binding protein [Glaciibacter superstes]
MLELRDIGKSFGGRNVLEHISLEVQDAEFLVLLGPSGCGKSTLLRIIAGLAEPSFGAVVLGGRDITGLDPRRRNMAFVFQTYALYPHFTVRENIGLPLALERWRNLMWVPILNRRILKRAVSHGSVGDSVRKVADSLEILNLLDSKPKELSGGQRQRVALARSLVRNPSLFLLDEPLSNLDAKLRQQMRVEISALHKRVGRTFVYVTHDQVEAMTMATRVVVLNRGEIQQVGSPHEVYEKPRNVFVAKFVGSPPMNIAGYSQLGGGADLEDMFRDKERETGIPAERLLMGVRPERLTLRPDDAFGEVRLTGRVFVVENQGNSWVYRLRVQGEELITTSGSQLAVFSGDDVVIGFERADVHWFDSESGLRVEGADT